MHYVRGHTSKDSDELTPELIYSHLLNLFVRLFYESIGILGLGLAPHGHTRCPVGISQKIYHRGLRFHLPYGLE